MHDLTSGSISRHLLKTTSFMLVTMVFQTLYFLVDLYWVGRLGKEAVAAVGVAGNLTFVVLAITQMLGVGTTTLISHAAGRKDRKRALLVFNQAQVLSALVAVLFLVAAMSIRQRYCSASASRRNAEFFLMAVNLFVVYIVSRPFGAAAQAGFGIGMRIVQSGSCRWWRWDSPWRGGGTELRRASPRCACGRRSGSPRRSPPLGLLRPSADGLEPPAAPARVPPPARHAGGAGRLSDQVRVADRLEPASLAIRLTS